MSVQQLYQKVTDNIITEIEAGNLPPWLQPWKSGKRGGIIPVNAVTKKPYSGLNVLMLWHARQEKQYPLAEWLTYKQCQEAGGQVRKGEKSTIGIYVSTASGLRETWSATCPCSASLPKRYAPAGGRGRSGSRNSYQHLQAPLGPVSFGTLLLLQR